MYQKHKKQFFIAEDPGKLTELIEQREQALSSMKRHVADVLPELRSLYVHGGMKPVVKYYEGAKGIRIILRDLLTTMSEERERRLYRVYSSAGLREYLYKEFPDFTKERIKRDIEVRAIAVGPGGEDQPLAERRWIEVDGSAFTYTLIYGQKVAFISLGDKEQIHGVLIEDARIAMTERMLFDHAWKALEGQSGREQAKKIDRVKQAV
jgi:sugar-specific transcriptional regulator TrmB